MRLPPDGFFIPRRGAAMKGLGIWRWQGERLYFQRAPRRVPTPRSEAERFNRAQLYWSTQVVKIMDAYQRDFALSMSKATQLAAQDFLYISLFGRVGHMVRRDGTVIYSMAAMQDVSKTLDAIGQLKGQLLVKGDPWWQALDIGPPGKVLGVIGDGLIDWVDPTPAFAGHTDEWMNPPPMSPSVGSTNTGVSAFIALPVYPNDAFNVTGVELWLTNKGGSTQGYAGLYKAGAASPILTGATLIGQGAPITTVAGKNVFPFTAPLPVTKNDWYFLGVNLRGTGSYNLAARDYARTVTFFALASNTLPATAPAASITTGNNTSFWGY